MRDIRMLTLLKQHYLDKYNTPLECQISCWGYYDGINIDKLEKTNSQLFEKRTESPVSELWYSAMSLAHNLKGRHSEQNIGLFRKKDELSKDFWGKYDDMPYFTVGFLQLDDSMKYKEVAEKIELEQQIVEEREEDMVYAQSIAYYTFDNADLVVLIHSNSIKAMENAVKKIEEMAEIRYFHSIMGISETYLKACKEAGEILELWKGNKCWLEDRLAKITMKFVTSGDRYIENLMREEWNFPVNNVRTAFATGHENLVMDIHDTNVRMLVQLLLPEGFATHQNKLYDKGIVYNIETSFRTNETEWQNLEVSSKVENNRLLSTWCEKKMDKYRIYMMEAWQSGNESLYSYFNSLLKMLNTLAQYEDFMLSQDVFHLVFPAFELFDRQLDKALENVGINGSTVVMEKIEESIHSFLDSVSSVVYHTIHTDQMFLMVPGCTGTTFSLPIKLCLLYLWFVNKIIYILNDSKKRYEYKCLLSPEMESKPTTELICLGLPHGDRLICVKLSQRSLYMPRNLFVILAHEIAHYVGEDIRCRKFRAGYILRTISAILARRIVAGVELMNKNAGNAYRLDEVEHRLQKQIIYDAETRLREVKESNVADYYDSFTKDKLEIIFHTILVDENKELTRICNELPADYFKKNTEQSGDYKQRLYYIFKIQQQFEANRNEILYSGVVRGMLHELSSIYREVFSDIAAYEVLKFDFETYEEAFYISDGRKKPDINVEESQNVRVEILQYLTGEQKTEKKANEEGHKEKIAPEITPSTIMNELFKFDCTKRFLWLYVKESLKAIDEFINSDERRAVIEEVRKVFHIFSEKGDLTCEEIYDSIQEKNNDYKGEILKLREELDI